MKRFLFLLPLLVAAQLWAASAASGQQFKLIGPKEAEVNRPFEVSVEGLSLPLSAFTSAPPQITWLVLCGEAQVKQRLELLVTMQDGKPVWSAAPYVTLMALKPAKLGIVLIIDSAGEFARQASLEVTCGPPTPIPPPPPPPPPVNVSRIYLIHESAQSTPAIGAVREDINWKNEATALGLQWRVIDITQTAKLLPAVAQAANAAGLPCVVCCNADGKVTGTTPLPGTKEAMLGLVQSLKKGVGR